MEISEKNKYIFIIAAAIIAICAWYIWNIIYRNVDPLPDPQITLNAAKEEASDYKTAAKAVQNSGYATDPTYADKLINMIETYHLNQYDKSSSI